MTPDNFEKKFLELRQLMFGDLKHAGEEGYDPEIHKPLTLQLSDDNMNIIVETIFRKAQNEKGYVNFYGEVCEKIIRLELSLRGLKSTVKTQQQSNFRKTLLENCKTSFNQFFMPDINEKRK